MAFKLVLWFFGVSHQTPEVNICFLKSIEHTTNATVPQSRQRRRGCGGAACSLGFRAPACLAYQQTAAWASSLDAVTQPADVCGKKLRGSSCRDLQQGIVGEVEALLTSSRVEQTPGSCSAHTLESACLSQNLAFCRKALVQRMTRDSNRSRRKPFIPFLTILSSDAVSAQQCECKIKTLTRKKFPFSPGQPFLKCPAHNVSR